MYDGWVNCCTEYSHFLSLTQSAFDEPLRLLFCLCQDSIKVGSPIECGGNVNPKVSVRICVGMIARDFSVVNFDLPNPVFQHA